MTALIMRALISFQQENGVIYRASIQVESHTGRIKVIHVGPPATPVPAQPSASTASIRPDAVEEFRVARLHPTQYPRLIPVWTPQFARLRNTRLSASQLERLRRLTMAREVLGADVPITVTEREEPEEESSSGSDTEALVDVLGRMRV